MLSAQPPFIQPKLAIGAPDDAYEREADRAAETVMRMPEPDCHAPLNYISRQESNTAMLDNVPSSVHETLALSGRPLDNGTRSFMEPRFGHDFSRVRIHADAKAAESAQSINARAYTAGNHLVFNRGQYAPDTSEGKKLLGHELSHVVQQGGYTHTGTAEQVTDENLVSVSNLDKPIIQRVCGPENIGPSSDCKGISEDVSQSLETSRSFLFYVNCDDFKPGEEAALVKFVKDTATSSNDLIEIHGFASIEGPQDFNINLSCARAKKAKAVLIKESLYPPGSPRLNSHGPVPGDKEQRRSVVVRVQFPRVITQEEQSLLDRITKLGEAAKKEGKGGEGFSIAIEEFRIDLKSRIESLKAGDPLPDDIQIIMQALLLWSKDPGNKWGEGIWDSQDLVMSAAEYATVPASQYKCNAYVAEVLYNSLGIVQKVHESEEQPGKYFPYRASEWGNASLTIPDFPVVTTPQLGDIWSNGSHIGIYLGTYNKKRLYISARDRGSGVFGIKEQVQQTHGIQIKYLEESGVYRRYTP